MNQLQCAGNIAKAIRKSSTVGHIVLFDGENFIGITPVHKWQTCLQEASAALIFDQAVIIAHDPIPPTIDLQAQAAACDITYLGTIHDSPPRPSSAPPAVPARLLH